MTGREQGGICHACCEDADYLFNDDGVADRPDSYMCGGCYGITMRTKGHDDLQAQASANETARQLGAQQPGPLARWAEAWVINEAARQLSAQRPAAPATDQTARPVLVGGVRATLAELRGAADLRGAAADKPMCPTRTHRPADDGDYCSACGYSGEAIIAAQGRQYPKLEVALPQSNMIAMVPKHQLDAARKRISELEAERASMWVERKPIVAENIGATDRIAELELLLASANEETRRVRADLVVSVKEAAVSYERANRLSDDAGALRTELRDVKAELADALRKVERLERKAGKR